MKNKKSKTRYITICPDDVCLLVEEEVPASEVHMAGRPSVWLNIFCPEGACEISSLSQLP